MPTYEYECQKCRHRFEAFQGMKEAHLTKCPKCKGKVKRQIGGGAGLIFKGSGFYITDYKKTSASSTESKKESSSEPKKKPSPKPAD